MEPIPIDAHWSHILQNEKVIHCSAAQDEHSVLKDVVLHHPPRLYLAEEGRLELPRRLRAHPISSRDPYQFGHSSKCLAPVVGTTPTYVAS